MSASADPTWYTTPRTYLQPAAMYYGNITTACGVSHSAYNGKEKLENVYRAMLASCSPCCGFSPTERSRVAGSAILYASSAPPWEPALYIGQNWESACDGVVPRP